MAEYIRIKICNTRPTVWIGLVQSLQSSSVSSTFRHCQATSTQILAMTASKTGMTRYDRCQCLHASAETYPTSPDLPHPLLSGSMCTLHHLAPPCTTLHHLAPPCTQQDSLRFEVQGNKLSWLRFFYMEF